MPELEFLNSLWGSWNRVGIGLSHRPDRLHRLAESIPGLHKRLNIRALVSRWTWTEAGRWSGRSSAFSCIKRRATFFSEIGTRVEGKVWRKSFFAFIFLCSFCMNVNKLCVKFCVTPNHNETLTILSVIRDLFGYRCNQLPLIEKLP